MKEPDAGTPQPDSRPATIEAKWEGRRQSKQLRNLNSPACYSARNNHGDRLSKNWTPSGRREPTMVSSVRGDLRNSIGMRTQPAKLGPPVPEPVAAELEHKEPQNR